MFIEALVPDEHNSSVIHGGHKLYRMDKIPTDAYSSIISLSDKEYFTEVSIYGKYLTQFEDTKYGLLANAAPLIEYKNNYIIKYINDIKNGNELNAAVNKISRLYFDEQGSPNNEFQEIPKTYHDLDDSNNDNITTYVLFNDTSYSGLLSEKT